MSGVGKIRNFQPVSRRISETVQDRTKVRPTANDSHIRPSIGAKINDLGWPWTADTHSVPENSRLSEPTTKIWMKIDPYYQRQKCRPMTILSSDIRLMRIIAEVPWSCGERQFSAFSLAIFSETLEMRPALLHSNTQSVVSFSVIPQCMTLNGYIALNSVSAPRFG